MDSRLSQGEWFVLTWVMNVEWVAGCYGVVWLARDVFMYVCIIAECTHIYSVYYHLCYIIVYHWQYNIISLKMPRKVFWPTSFLNIEIFIWTINLKT